MPIANFMDGYDEMLSDLTENGLSAAFWMSLISDTNILELPEINKDRQLATSLSVN